MTLRKYGHLLIINIRVKNNNYNDKQSEQNKNHYIYDMYKPI